MCNYPAFGLKCRSEILPVGYSTKSPHQALPAKIGHHRSGDERLEVVPGRTELSDSNESRTAETQTSLPKVTIKSRTWCFEICGALGGKSPIQNQQERFKFELNDLKQFLFFSILSPSCIFIVMVALTKPTLRVIPATKILAKFVHNLRFQDWSSDVWTKLKELLLDYVGVTSAVSISADSTDPIYQGVMNFNSQSNSNTVLKKSQRHIPQIAALLNR